MAVENGIIKPPIGLASDIYSTLGLAPNSKGESDLGRACGNFEEKTNIWSRYKPVCIPKPYFVDTWNGTAWAEKSQIDITRWDRPWFYGYVEAPAYIIPTISSLKDIGEDGVANEGSVWRYNPPNGKAYPYNILHFVGYNHNANIPMYVGMNEAIIINGLFDTTIEEYGTSKANGEFEFSEILKMIRHSATLYAGIVIQNLTKKITVGYVKDVPLGDEYENGVFRLDPSKATPIKDGGFGHKVSTNDIIDVFVFLAEDPGETDISMMHKHSARIDAYYETYKRYIVGYRMVTVNISYYLSNLSKSVQNFIGGKKYYINDADYGHDGNIYEVSSYIEAIYGKLTVNRTNKSDYSTFRVFLSGDSVGTRTDGTTFQTQAVPYVVYRTLTNGNFNNSSYQYELNGSEGMSFIGYSTLQDAQRQENGTNFIGCPIYDKIVFNYADNENVGTLSYRLVKIACSAVSSLQYTQISMASTNNNNVIFSD